MITRVVLSVFATVAATQLASASGTAKMDYGNFNAGYAVELSENSLTGYQENLGAGSGQVELTKTDGLWEGRFGFSKIETREERWDSKRSVKEYTFSVLPGGIYRATIETKSDRTNIRLFIPNHDVARVTLKNGAYLDGHNYHVSVSLKRKSETNYGGVASSVDSRGRYASSPISLETSDGLNVETLIQEDPLLFVLLYVLPYNMKSR